MVTKKTLLIGLGIMLLCLAIWSIRTGPLWNKGPDDMPPPQIVTGEPKGEATIGSSKVSYSYEAASSTGSTKTDSSAPSLSRSVIIPSSFSSETADSAKKHIEAVLTSLKKNLSNAVLWGELGMARKGIEDYEGAKQAYEYALKLQPKNVIFADNLGVIYGDYLKNYTKAEEYYLLAVTLDPRTPYRYLRLFEFYRYLTKDMAKAKAILEQGLEAIPGETSLKTLLDSLN